MSMGRVQIGSDGGSEAIGSCSSSAAFYVIQRGRHVMHRCRDPQPPYSHP